MILYSGWTPSAFQEQCIKVPFPPHPRQHLVRLVLLILIIHNMYVVITHWVWLALPGWLLKSSIFVHLLITESSLENCPFTSSAHFWLNSLLVFSFFCSWVIWVPCVFKLLASYQMWFPNTFSHSRLPLHSATCFLCCVEPFLSDCSLISIFACTLVSHLKNCCQHQYWGAFPLCFLLRVLQFQVSH